VGHVARKGKRTMFWLEHLKGRDHAENLGVDGTII